MGDPDEKKLSRVTRTEMFSDYLSGTKKKIVFQRNCFDVHNNNYLMKKEGSLMPFVVFFFLYLKEENELTY